MDSLGRPGNDACATIAGFVYQVNVTIQHWLKLGPGEHLELEAGEDIDIVRHEAGESETDPEWLTIQLKQLSGSPVALGAICRKSFAAFWRKRRLECL
jgi:hypothetical protein